MSFALHRVDISLAGMYAAYRALVHPPSSIGVRRSGNTFRQTREGSWRGTSTRCWVAGNQGIFEVVPPPPAVLACKTLPAPPLGLRYWPWKVHVTVEAKML